MALAIAELGVSLEAQQALIEIRKFATRIWENPLVDEATRQMRYDGLQEAAAIIRIKSFKDQDYAGFLVGGLRYGEGDQTDVDILFYTPNPFLKDSLTRFRGRLAGSLLKKGIDPIRIFDPGKTSSEIHPLEALAYLSLLTTPDEYVIGNLDKAQFARMQVLDLIKQSPQSWTEVESQFQGNFINYFRGLPTYHATIRRMQKVLPRIEKRAKQSKIPDYKLAFLKTLDNFKLPSFETFRLGLEATAGELRMIKRYEAQGIK